MTKAQLIAQGPAIRLQLAAVYAQATEDERIEGARWYPSARAIVHDWATTYNLTPGTVACVIAAISPQCPWANNLIIADDVLADRAPSVRGCLPVSRDKAQSILRHARAFDERVRSLDPADYVTGTMRTLFPTGRKVQRFAHNLLMESDTHVTVDTHAIQAALGTVHKDSVQRNEYEPIECAYRDVARSLNVNPQTLQATIWLTWKRLHPTAVKRAAIRRERSTRFRSNRSSGPARKRVAR